MWFYVSNFHTFFILSIFCSTFCINLQSNIIYSPTFGTSADVPCRTPLHNTELSCSTVCPMTDSTWQTTPGVLFLVCILTKVFAWPNLFSFITLLSPIPCSIHFLSLSFFPQSVGQCFSSFCALFRLPIPFEVDSCLFLLLRTCQSIRPTVIV